MEPDASVPPNGHVEPPRGMYPGRLDDKGRLKVPAGFQQFLNSFGERKFFVTSLDRRLAQIYPMAVWRDNEKIFDAFTDNPEAAENIAFTAADLGAEAEMDAQGRITFNSELRKELDLEGHELHLHAFQGRIEVMTEAMYQEKRRISKEKTASDLTHLRKAGLR